MAFRIFESDGAALTLTGFTVSGGVVAAGGAAGAVAAASLRTGAGWSGSAPSVVGSSIQRTMSPSE